MRFLLYSFLFFVTLSSSRLHGQENIHDINWSVLGQVFNEVDVSANFSVNKYCKNKFGGGLGVKHIFLNDRWYNIGVGIEYNFTQYKRYYGIEVSGNNYPEPDVVFHNITIPGMARFNVGTGKLKALFELGLYLEVSMPRLTYEYTVVDINGKTVVEVGKYKLSVAFNGGPQASIGMKISVGKHNIILKGQYRFGIKRNLAQSEMFQVFSNDYISFNVSFNWAK